MTSHDGGWSEADGRSRNVPSEVKSGASSSKVSTEIEASMDDDPSATVQFVSQLHPFADDPSSPSLFISLLGFFFHWEEARWVGEGMGRNKVSLGRERDG